MFTKMAQRKCLPFFAVFSKYGKLFVSPDPTLKNGTSSSCRNSTAIYKEKKSLCFNTPVGSRNKELLCLEINNPLTQQTQSLIKKVSICDGLGCTPRMGHQLM